MSESDIENKFVRWCEGEGYPCLKLKIEGQRGFPDRTVILPNGRSLFVEFKKPGGKLSPQQRDWAKRLKALGHHWITTVDPSFAVLSVEELL